MVLVECELKYYLKTAERETMSCHTNLEPKETIGVGRLSALPPKQQTVGGGGGRPQDLCHLLTGRPKLSGPSLVLFGSGTPGLPR